MQIIPYPCCKIDDCGGGFHEWREREHDVLSCLYQMVWPVRRPVFMWHCAGRGAAGMETRKEHRDRCRPYAGQLAGPHRAFSSEPLAKQKICR